MHSKGYLGSLYGNYEIHRLEIRFVFECSGRDVFPTYQRRWYIEFPPLKYER